MPNPNADIARRALARRTQAQIQIVRRQQRTLDHSLDALEELVGELAKFSAAPEPVDCSEPERPYGFPVLLQDVSIRRTT